MPDSAPAAKICVVCKQDCSKKPRTRDAKGQYLCGTCQQTMATPKGAPTAPNAPARPGQTPRAEQADAASANQDGPLELEGFHPSALQDLLRAEAGAVPVAPPPVQDFDPPPPGSGAGDARKCPACGYSLKGLKGTTCPECGAQARYKSGRVHAQEAIEEEARQTVRMAYVRPTLLLVIGLLALGIIRGVQGEGDRVLSELVVLAIRIPVGIIVYFICCATFLGFNAPVHLTALRLGGVYAIMAAVWALADGYPIGIFRLALVGLYILLLMSELDLDRGDAIIMALLTGGAMVVFSLLALYLIPSLGG